MELVLFLFCVGAIAALLAVLARPRPNGTGSDLGRPQVIAESGWTEALASRSRFSANAGRGRPVAARHDRRESRAWSGLLYLAYVGVLLAALRWTDFSVTDRIALGALGLCATGAVLNQAVVRLNGGRMPVRAAEVPPGFERTHRPMDGRTRARALGDWLAVRGWLMSPGDLFVAAGQAVVFGCAVSHLAYKYAGMGPA